MKPEEALWKFIGGVMAYLVLTDFIKLSQSDAVTTVLLGYAIPIVVIHIITIIIRTRHLH